MAPARRLACQIDWNDMLIPAPNDPASSQGAPRPGAATPAGPGDHVDPLDLLLVLGRQRRMLVLWPFVAAVVAAIISLLLPEVYTGVTRMLPPQQAQSSAAAMLSQLGGLASAAGPALGLKNPGDLYVGLLKSETVSDALIERFGLMERYHAIKRVDARKALAAKTRIVPDKSGIIAIEVDDREPARAADLANGYVEELHRLTSTLAVTEAAQRRVFFERQLQQAREKLADAEVKLRQAIDTGGLVSVDAQGRAAVETVARLRAQVSAKEIQISSMRSYATDGNPDLRRAEQELASIRGELARLETGVGSTGAGGKLNPAEAAAGVANIRLLRDVKYAEAMFEFLAKQYELARVDEGKEAPIVQVVDPAKPPERRTSPMRTIMVLGTAAVAFVLAVLAALIRHAFDVAMEDQGRRAKLAALKATWLRRGN